MQFPPKNQKRLVINNELGRNSTLLKMRQPRMRITRLANSRSTKRHRDEKGNYTKPVQLLFPILRTWSDAFIIPLFNSLNTA